MMNQVGVARPATNFLHDGYFEAPLAVADSDLWTALEGERCRQAQPQLLIAGGSSYPRQIDFARMRDIADAVGATLMVDMAHFAGLVASGLHPHPFPHAHVVTTTTYKSLRGARGGVILCDDPDLARKIAAAVFPGVQGSVLLHGVAGKAACLGEALRPEFRLYNEAVLANGQAFATVLDEVGVRLVTGGTDTGMLLVDLRPKGLTGSEAVDSLERAGLTCNKNVVPFDPQPPEVASGLRLSTNAGTTRGFGVGEFARVGEWIGRVLDGLASRPGDNGTVEQQVRTEVLAMCRDYPLY